MKKSNDIVEVSDCILASAKINSVISVLNSNSHDKRLIEELSKESITEIVIRDVEEGIAIFPRIKRLEEILDLNSMIKLKKLEILNILLGKGHFFK